jgi:hypothetical protein
LHQSGSDWTSFGSTVSSLYEALAADQKCKDFLATFGTMADVTKLLSTSVAQEYTLASDITLPVPGLGFGSYGDLPKGTTNGALIAINWGTFNNQVDIGHQYAIILHEMAHAIGAPPDGFGTAATAQLDADIATQCKKEVGQ